MSMKPVRHARRGGSILLALALTLFLLVPSAAAQQREERDLRVCDRTSLGLVPLTDLGTATHEGFQGGLYPGGSNDIPAAHLEVGLEHAAQIVPRDASGEPDPNGRIGLLSVGVSNAKNKFRRFMDVAPAAYELSTELVLVNGAQGGKPVQEWMRQTAGAWSIVDGLLADAGLTPAQVQAAWIMLPEIRTEGEFPEHAVAYQAMLEEVLRTMLFRYPNLQITYMSSRNYAGYGQGLSIEPFAYEMGFSTKWVIESQIGGEPGSVAGVDMPWLRWGPYTWADGLGPDGVEGGMPGRSDGLEWTCDEMSSDGIHPSGAGATKTAHMLADHLATDPTSASWFLASGTAAGAAEEPAPTTTMVSSTTTTLVLEPAPTETTSSTAVTQPPRTQNTAGERESRDGGFDPSWPLLGGLAAVLAVGLGLVVRTRVEDRVRNGSTRP